jgi:hypothetical protein
MSALDTELQMEGVFVVPLAELQFNASYLRVSVFGSQFDNSTSTVRNQNDTESMKSGLAKNMLKDAAMTTAKRYSEKKDIDYVEIQGISGQSVGLDDEMEVSRKRALNFENELVSDKIIGTPKNANAKDVAASQTIPLEAIECYGTGHLIDYAHNSNRVDLRLFFTDNGPDNNGKPTN